jgi:hypothetical protein
MLSIGITGDREVQRQLRAVTRAMPKQIDAGLAEVGRIVQSEAMIRTPQSPTKGQSKSYNGPSKSRWKQGRAPGTLTRAIKLVKKRGEVIVGVISGAALKYANYIHNGQGTAWTHIGPGSTAKQGAAKVGGKFLDRAYDENINDLQSVYESEIAKALP